MFYYGTIGGTFGVDEIVITKPCNSYLSAIVALEMAIAATPKEEAILNNHFYSHTEIIKTDKQYSIKERIS